MKIVLAALVLVFSSPVEAKVGKKGDCPSTKTGYCQTVQDWWLEQILRS
jgi:hypothetical protein